ncbi:hypothetical protein GUJ93_ZPchr0009g1865 [Zizania palustris]|uniref:EF-hand domain-containing protein n=1 Tax=Zizania palustris TaxID=103762 RepID=A0A8J5S4R9_ZIZPA|nr:hypothetical protein GUJ93_ZPchr0009g1260 [Zizania palustris]KAG8049991.1 hypothetical protein GUJ93_ZPchr0009g1865 [Zizania palustris]
MLGLCFGIESGKTKRGVGLGVGVPCDGMTEDEFKAWIRQFDVDRDGRISRDELRRAMRAMGVRFMGHYKCKRGMIQADANGNGYIDDDEIDGLVEFLRNLLRIRLVAY